MKRTVFRIGLGLLLLMLGAHMYSTGSTGRGETAMKTFAFAAERPSIDRSIPAQLETATFALG